MQVTKRQEANYTERERKMKHRLTRRLGLGQRIGTHEHQRGLTWRMGTGWDGDGWSLGLLG